MAILRDTVTNTTNLTMAIGGSVPSAGDDVIIENIAVVIDAGVDISTNEINSLTVAPSFTGRTTPSADITVDLNGTTSYEGLLTLNHSGGDLNFVAGGSGATIAVARILRTGAGASAYFRGGTLAQVEMSGGRAQINASTVISGTVYVAGGFLEILTHASDTVSTINVDATGNAVVKRDCTTVNVDGGLVTFEDAKPTNANINNGTMMYHNSENLSNIVVKGRGVLDLSQITGDITLGVTRYPGSRIIGSKTYTVTPTQTLIGGASDAIE